MSQICCLNNNLDMRFKWYPLICSQRKYTILIDNGLQGLGPGLYGQRQVNYWFKERERKIGEIVRDSRKGNRVHEEKAEQEMW